jgi:competence protein ComEA
MKHLMIALAALLLALPLAQPAGAAVNVNTATKDELVALPGIGPAKAQAIVDYRNQHGPFRSVDDVRKVKGIGEKLFLQIRSELVVSGSPRAAAAAPKVDAKADAKAAPSVAGTIARDDKAKR